MEDNQYRAGVGAVIINSKKQILMFARSDNGAWKLPQGGLNPNENNIEGLFREIKEETRLDRSQLVDLKNNEEDIYVITSVQSDEYVVKTITNNILHYFPNAF